MHEQLQQFVPEVYRYARYLLQDHHDAEEVTQDTMLKAWDRRFLLRKPDACRAWVFRVATNLCRDRIRQRQRRGSSQSHIEEQHLSTQPGALHKLVQSEQLKQVEQAMQALPDRCREVLYLNVFLEMTHEQIAKVLKISISASKVHLSKARAQLRQQLKHIDPHHERPRTESTH